MIYKPQVQGIYTFLNTLIFSDYKIILMGSNNANITQMRCMLNVSYMNFYITVNVKLFLDQIEATQHFKKCKLDKNGNTTEMTAFGNIRNDVWKIFKKLRSIHFSIVAMNALKFKGRLLNSEYLIYLILQPLLKIYFHFS